METIKEIRVREQDGTVSSPYPIGADAKNIDTADGSNVEEKFKTLGTKDDLKILENQIKSVASGSPLVASSISGMKDTTRTYVNTTDGKWYYYNGNTWIAGGVYQASEIENNSITPNKTTFTKHTNLFNPNDDELEYGGYYDAKGVFTKNNYHNASGFMPVKPNEYYYATATGSIATFWNANKEFIAGGFTDNKGILYIPDNPDIKFCRMAVHLKFMSSMMFTESDKPLPYAPFGVTEFNDDVKIQYENLPDYLKLKFQDVVYEYEYVASEAHNAGGYYDDVTLVFPALEKTSLSISIEVENILNITDIPLLNLFTANSEDAGKWVEHVIEYKTPLVKDNTYRFNFTVNLPTNHDYKYLKLNLTHRYGETRPTNVKGRINRLSLIFNSTKLLNNNDIKFIDFYGRTSISTKKYAIDDNTKKYSKDFSTKNIAIFGDSITWLPSPKSWVDVMKNELNFNNVINYALSGCRWANKVDTQYDIVGRPGSATPNNVIWNQYNRLKNDVDKGIISTPDIILICCGTNDQWVDNARFYGDVDTAFNGEITNKPVTEILTVAESIRYNVELLLNAFPNAQIILATMLQRGIDDLSTIHTLNELVKKCANRLSLKVIDQTYESGVYSYYEKGGKHKYLYDGTHPNENGAKKIGIFIANELDEKIVI